MFIKLSFNFLVDYESFENELIYGGYNSDETAEVEEEVEVATDESLNEDKLGENINNKRKAVPESKGSIVKKVKYLESKLDAAAQSLNEIARLGQNNLISHPSYLECLPQEILFNVFSYLSNQDLYHISLMSQKLALAVFDQAVQAKILENHLVKNDWKHSTERLFQLSSYCGPFVKNLFLSDFHITQKKIVTLIVQTIENCPNLQTLNLSGFDIANKELKSVVSKLSQLAELYLVECPNIRDQELKTIASSLPNLQLLDLEGCKVKREGVEALASLTKLKHLSLCCRALTNQDLNIITASLTQLQFLHLSQGDYLTDAGLSPLTELTELEDLSFSECPQLTDNGLTHIVFHLSKLKTLKLYKCRHITNKCVLAIAFKVTTLKEFVINKCNKITKETIDLKKD